MVQSRKVKLHMKKKLLALLCVLTCIFGLTACGNSTEYTEQQERYINVAKVLSKASVEVAKNDLFLVKQEQNDPNRLSYNKEEMATIYAEEMYSYMKNRYDYSYFETPELGAFDGLLNTYAQMEADMGTITSIDYENAESEIVGKEIVITIKVYGEKVKEGTIICKFSNDMFMRFHEGDAQANTNFSQKMEAAGKSMGNAGVNTLLGMGTVFIMLILISLIISAFVLLQKKPKKETASAVAETPATVPVVEEELVDDTELVAVIMAAIKAYEGNGSTDGFVVRSIKKANRRM